MEKRTSTLMLICAVLLVLGYIHKRLEHKEGFVDDVIQICPSGKPSMGYPCCANGESSLGKGCCVDGTPSYGYPCPALINFSQNSWYPL